MAAQVALRRQQAQEEAEAKNMQQQSNIPQSLSSGKLTWGHIGTVNPLFDMD